MPKVSISFFFFNIPSTTEFYTLSLHDALPICVWFGLPLIVGGCGQLVLMLSPHQSLECRSEEHTSELQSRRDLVCRLLLEKKKNRERVEMPQDSITGLRASIRSKSK